MQTFDLYFRKDEGRGQYRVRKVFASREAARAYGEAEAAEGYVLDRVRAVGHRQGKRGWR